MSTHADYDTPKVVVRKTTLSPGVPVACPRVSGQHFSRFASEARVSNSWPVAGLPGDADAFGPTHTDSKLGRGRDGTAALGGELSQNSVLRVPVDSAAWCRIQCAAVIPIVGSPPSDQAVIQSYNWGICWTSSIFACQFDGFPPTPSSSAYNCPVSRYKPHDDCSARLQPTVCDH